MIRLAVSGVHGPALQQLSRRLRGAVVEPPGERDAAIVVDYTADAVASVEMFLRSGKRVLILATLCPSLPFVDQLVSYARGDASRIAIVNPLRYLPSRRLIKGEIDAGKLGTVGLVRIHHRETDDSVDRSALLCSHLDLATWLSGRQPECVYATTDGNTAYTQVHLGFASGASALIEVSMPRLAPAPMSYTVRPDYRSLLVIGSAGAASADDQMREPEGQLRLAVSAQEFVNDVAAGIGFASTVDQWRQALRIGQAVDRSLATHRAIWLEAG